MTSPEVLFTICCRATASPHHILKSLIIKLSYGKLAMTCYGVTILLFFLHGLIGWQIICRPYFLNQKETDRLGLQSFGKNLAKVGEIRISPNFLACLYRAIKIRAIKLKRINAHDHYFFCCFSDPKKKSVSKKK